MRLRSFQSLCLGAAMRRLASLHAYWISDLSCARKFNRAVMLLYWVASFALSTGESSTTSTAKAFPGVLTAVSSSRAPGVVTGLLPSRPRSLTTISACRWSDS